jgi:hypothetical protein
MILSIMPERCYAVCHLYCVFYKPFMLIVIVVNVVLLSVVAPKFCITLDPGLKFTKDLKISLNYS